MELRIYNLKQAISNRAARGEREEKSPGLKWFGCYRCASGLCCENCVNVIFLGKPLQGADAPKCPVCRYETCNENERVEKHWDAVGGLAAPDKLPPLVASDDDIEVTTAAEYEVAFVGRVQRAKEKAAQARAAE